MVDDFFDKVEENDKRLLKSVSNVDFLDIQHDKKTGRVTIDIFKGKTLLTTGCMCEELSNK